MGYWWDGEEQKIDFVLTKKEWVYFMEDTDAFGEIRQKNKKWAKTWFVMVLEDEVALFDLCDWDKVLSVWK